ncbi:SMP-30/gluconolactonase/LRE family protein [Mycobacterium sp. DSM 3803]|nr:SMP-30/gluconolactonase/LRE family protein [Mycobacterium sp. DSM 3803]
MWDPIRERLLWVDIEGGQVLTGRLTADSAIECTGAFQFSGTVGCVVPAHDGRLLVAEQQALTVLDEPTGSRAAGPRLIDRAVHSRLNDGKCDPAGRMFVGTLALDGRTGEEALYTVRHGVPSPVDTDLSLSNGLGWSPSGDLLYSIDTLARTVWARSYDLGTGGWGPRRASLHVDDGYPDGMCVDVDGNLWIAIWGAGQVRCYSTTGKLLAVVEVPAPHTSSACFVGEHLDRLLITTARSELTDTQLRDYPDSGKLFLVDVGTTGTAVSYWAG